VVCATSVPKFVAGSIARSRCAVST
jgi:hypothetical protein